MIQFIPYLRVTRPPPPPPDPTICDRLATNNRGSLRFLTMSEIPAVKDVSVWEGAASMETGIHQQYMYEADETLAFPEIIQDHQATILTTQPVSPDVGFESAQLDDLILAFMSATGSIVPKYFLDLPVLEGTERVRVSDTNQDDFVLQTIDVPSPHGTAEFYVPGSGNTLFIATGILIRNGARDVYASSQISGSSIVETITPSEDQSIVVACLSYQGTDATLPSISGLDGSWNVLRTVNLSNAAGTLHGLQVLAVKEVQTAALTTFSCTLEDHDGSNTTSVILAAIKPTGGLDSIWQQFILLKDTTGDFTPGEVLSIQ